jgi:hypothetical protein
VHPARVLRGRDEWQMGLGDDGELNFLAVVLFSMMIVN